MAQYCYTHMALLLIVVQSHFIVENILEGMIWSVKYSSLSTMLIRHILQVCNARCVGGVQ
jgi:hypothetical protein